MIDISNKEAWQPNEAQSKFVLDAYTDFQYDRNLRMQKQPLLDGRTLQEFWDYSESEYNVIVGPEDINDPVTPYASAISRDKANAFISALTQQLLVPSVAAQNSLQEIDRKLSQISRSILKWQYDNDGRPAESGLIKFARAVHKMVVTGTVHVQDDVNECGQNTSNIVANEEIYLPNLFQPNIQKQSRVIRMQNAIEYGEAEREFGELDNFKRFVIPGMSAVMRLFEESEFRQWFLAVTPKDAVHIMRIWRPVPYKKLQEYKRTGKLPKHVKCAKYFNVIINGILMFDPENLSPYHHGMYPISKGVFEWFSNPEFYYGNSLPNKARHDKKWLDGWKQLIRYKAKLSTIPPLITFNGSFVDSDVIVPGMISQAPAGMAKDDIISIPGISNGLTNSDLAILNDGMSDIDRSTTAPQTAGQQGGNRTTAREALLIDANAKEALKMFGLQVAAFTEARSFPILKNSYQYLPKLSINKLSIPDQPLSSGSQGTLEVLFSKPVEMTKSELEKVEEGIYKEEAESAKKGAPKNIVILNTEYVRDLDFYLVASVDNAIRENSALREAKAEMHFNTYLSRPDIFNVRSAARQLVTEYGDNPDEMINPEPKQDMMQEQLADQANPDMAKGTVNSRGMGSGSMQNPLSKMGEQSSVRIADNTSRLPVV